MGSRVRFWIVALLLALSACGVGTRLALLHLHKVDATPREPRYTFKRSLPALRGAIYPSNPGATPLARSVPVWEYRADPKAVVLDKRHLNRVELANYVADALGLDPKETFNAFARVDSRYVYLATSSDDAAHAKIAGTNVVSGVVVEERQTRLYPQSSCLSHVVGFVSRDPDNPVGGAGIEMKCEKDLRGLAGEIVGVRTARGMEIRSKRKVSVEPTPGCNVYLTVDVNLQRETEKAIREGMRDCWAERAWAVMLSARTGAVLAMASLPDYEPESYNRYPKESLRNRVVSENYEPGSVMKTITACAVLNERVAGPDTMMDTRRDDPRYYRLPGDGSHVWPAMMSVRDALVHSSNIVFGKLGVNLGPERLHRYMQAFGLGERTGVGLPGEEVGILPPPGKWDKLSCSRAPIGQFVAVTAMQLAAAYCAIANDGEMLRPYVVERIVEPGGEVRYEHKREVVSRPVSAATARKVREMMEGVAKRGGTARRAAVRGYSVAGKTGTAQMKEGRGYSSRNYNATFIGMVPATRPEIVLLVTYQKPAYNKPRPYNHQGGVCAAPTFSRIATYAMRYLGVEPDRPDEIPEDE